VGVGEKLRQCVQVSHREINDDDDDDDDDNDDYDGDGDGDDGDGDDDDDDDHDVYDECRLDDSRGGGYDASSYEYYDYNDD
jgi:hypothetical protein